MRFKASSVIFSTPMPEERFLSLGEGHPRFLVYFAGRFTYLDLYMSALGHVGNVQHLVFSRNYAELTHNYLEGGWGEEGWKVMPLFPEDGDAPVDKSMFNTLKSQLRSWVFLVQADHPAVFDAREIIKVVQRRDKLLVPVVDETIIPCMLVEKSLFLDTIKKQIKDELPARNALANSFRQLLHSKKLKHVPMDGYVSDIRNLAQYYKANFDVLKQHEHFNALFRAAPLHSGVGEKAEALIESSAEFLNSWISDGCIVRGKVSNSVLFPGVIVGKGAVVEDSILLPGTIVGNKSRLRRCLVDAPEVLPPNIKTSIGEGCQLGGKSTKTSNSEHPSLFQNFSYVASRTVIPANIRIGMNCYVMTGVNKAVFRRQKQISDGRTLHPRAIAKSGTAKSAGTRGESDNIPKK